MRSHRDGKAVTVCDGCFKVIPTTNARKIISGLKSEGDPLIEVCSDPCARKAQEMKAKRPEAKHL